MKFTDNLRKHLLAGTFGVSLMLHLLVFFAISGVILIQAIEPKQPFVAGDASSSAAEVAPPPELPPDDLSPVPENFTETAEDAAPSNALTFEPELISANVSVAAPVFAVAPPSAMGSGVVPGVGGGSGRGEKGVARISRGMANPFGNADPDTRGLKGYLYDLKQTAKRQPTKLGPDKYFGVLEKFFTEGWNREALADYYQVPRPLYTTQVFIPNMNAELAPKAFEADKEVKPSMWVIHYRGRVSPPENGTYRFVGCADDVIAVAVNHSTVLLAPAAPFKSLWVRDAKTNPPGPRAGAQIMQGGDWLELKAGEVYDLDVLIGERPGGNFNAYLMIEKKGEKYKADGQGAVLPIFQLAAYDTPDPPAASRAASFARNGKVWKVE